MNFKYYKTEALVAVICIISFINVAFLNWIESYINKIEIIKNISDYVSFLSAFGLLILTLKLIDKYLWKYRWIKFLIDIPDLSGRYEGKLISSYNGTEKKCVMEITQTSSSITIYSYFGDIGANELSSESASITAEIVKERNDFFTVYYNFKNESNQLIQMNDHRGTAYLKYYPDLKKLDGSYFNERMNAGKLDVVYRSSNLIGRYNEQ